MSRLIHLSRKPYLLKHAAPLLNPNNGGQFRNYYMSRLFPMSNTSFQLSSGNAITANVVRLTDQMLLVDSGIGTPKTCLEDELIGVKNNKNKIRFENRVGFLDLVSGETLINKQILERFFIDLVAGDKTAKERAAARFNDLVAGSGDVDVDADADVVLPRRYRQKRVEMELSKIWRMNLRVKGFFVGRNRSGYAVAIAGFVAFLPYRSNYRMAGRKGLKDRFTIESLNLKTGNIVVT